MTPPEPVLVQGVAFVVAALTGVVCGLMLDAYRGLRRVAAPPAWLGHALDALFVAAVLPVVAAGMLGANWGELRVYPLAGLALGLALYLALGSPVLLPAGTATLRVAVRAVAAAVAALTWPVRATVGLYTRLRRPPTAAYAPPASPPRPPRGGPRARRGKRGAS